MSWERRFLRNYLEVQLFLVTFAPYHRLIMGCLKYKGYSGSVEYSEEDNCLYGKVLGMSKNAITYEGQDLAELKQDFEGAIDDYLAL